MKKPPTVPTCHPKREHKAKGLCVNCYNAMLINRNPATRAKHRAFVMNWQRRNPNFRKD